MTGIGTMLGIGKTTTQLHIPPTVNFIRFAHQTIATIDVTRIAAEKASQALREKSNAEKRQRSAQREAMRGKRDGSSDSSGPTKKSKVGETGISIASPLLANQLNYVGAPTAATQNLVTDAAKGDIKGVKVDPNKEDLKTEGLPPNAVDKDGNILVTDWDILAGRGTYRSMKRNNLL